MHHTVRLHCSGRRCQLVPHVSRALTARCSPCPPAACSCVEKSAVCEDCRERRRSLQNAGYQQCNCCDGLLCGDNSNYTGTVCAGPPSDPGIDGLMVIESEPYVYSIEITLIASDDTGAVGMGEFWASYAPILRSDLMPGGLDATAWSVLNALPIRWARSAFALCQSALTSRANAYHPLPFQPCRRH